MIAQVDPKAKLTILREHTEGRWYRGKYDVEVERSNGVKYMFAGMSKVQYELEKFLLELEIPQDKKSELCDKIDEYSSYKYREGASDEQYYSSGE